MAELFKPLELRGLTIANRIVVAPMTQFSARDGVAGDWHLMHLGNLAIGGAGLAITESTYVSANARNAPDCLSLYSDEQEAGIARIKRFIDDQGGARLGVQLCHAGRKASALMPWEGGGPRHVRDGGYPTVAPSAVPLDDNWPVPHALSTSEISQIVSDFESAAQRADRAGIDFIELHGAHGYLLHQFLSQVSNHREDEYGGSIQNRMRFLSEVFSAVRAVWPDQKPIGVRLSATDWIAGGWDLEQTVSACQLLQKLGADYVHISSGGLSPRQKISAGPGYQVPFAAEVKKHIDLPVIAVGSISEPMQAETILRTGQADLIALGRAMLYNPRWPWAAARQLGVEPDYPRQYERANPDRWHRPGINVRQHR